MVIAGDCAGVNLAAVLLLRLRDEGEALPASAVLAGLPPLLMQTGDAETLREVVA